MSLIIYTEKHNIPCNLKFININDSFFDVYTQLSDDDLCKEILLKIDKAEYNTPFTFFGRTKILGNLNKSMLSTGTKTLLNIINHPDICFNVAECGNNALQFLPKIQNGNILWEMPAVAYCQEADCNIILNGVQYHDFYELLHDIEVKYDRV